MDEKIHDPAAALLAEIELQWAEADRARGRVIRPVQEVMPCKEAGEEEA